MNREVRWRTPLPLGANGCILYADATNEIVLAELPDGAPALLVAALTVGATEDELLDLLGDSGLLIDAAWLSVFDALRSVGRALPSVGPPQEYLEVINGRPGHTGNLRTSGPLKLSRFAVITPHQQPATLLIEEPATGVRVHITARMFTRLLDDAAGAPGAETNAALELDWSTTAVAIAADYGLLVAADDQQESWWEPHDRYFHWRTRRDSHGHTSGATYPLGAQRAPLPVSEELASGQRLPLASPSYAGSDCLAGLLSARVTTRECATALTAADLEQFLGAHRVLEVLHPAAEAATTSTASPTYPQSRRLYPGGGATYELELCVTSAGVDGLQDGVWWYDAQDHTLVAMSDDPSSVSAMVADALVSSGGVGTPRALITYALRMGRNSWKYEGMAYRLALLNAGVLYHHAYLLAADLGLGVCGLGNGNSELFGRIAAHGAERLTSVAEVMLTGRIGP